MIIAKSRGKSDGILAQLDREATGECLNSQDGGETSSSSSLSCVSIGAKNFLTHELRKKGSDGGEEEAAAASIEDLTINYEKMIFVPAYNSEVCMYVA